MSLWNWISTTREITELIEGINETTLLLRKIQKSDLTTDQRINILKNSCDLKEIFTDARLRASVISQIPSNIIENYPSIKKAVELHYQIGSDAPTNHQLIEFIDCLGGSIEKKPEKDDEIDMPDETTLPSYSLYDYQNTVVNKSINLLSSGAKRFLIHMPTGTGKTRTAMAIISLWLNSSKGSVVWASYSRELIDQARDEFIKCWNLTGFKKANISYFTGEKDTILEEFDICFASLSKLGRCSRSYSTEQYKAIADKISLVVIDEAHQAIAQSYGESIDRLSRNNRSIQVVGLTATPGRTTNAEESGDADMSRFFRQEKVQLEVEGYESPIDYLISNGYLAEPHYIEIEPDRFAESTNSEITVQLCIEAINDGHSRIIAFSESIEQAKVATSVLNALGYETYFIDGMTPMRRRNQVYNIFKSETSQPILIINWGVLTTGFDAPKTSAVVISRPINSLIVYSQIIGRALRGTSAGGTKTASIYNVYKKDDDSFRDLVKSFMHWNSVWSNQ